MKSTPRNMAMNWLARREHSQAELREKLAARDFEPEIIAKTVAELASDGLVSDERFAESLVAVRMRKGQGPVRIRAELKKRGVSAELVQLHVYDAGHDWRALACEVRSRKFGDSVPAEFREKAKQMRFLEYRGFDTEQIKAAVGEA
jgi:regulatory protein